VTGAGAGLGRAIAEAFLDRGASLVAHYRTSLEGVRSLGEHPAREGAVLSVGADLSSPPEIRRVLDAAIHRFGRIDVVVNNASTLVRTPAEDLDAAAWDAVHALNLRAPALLAAWTGTRMRSWGGGVIVNVGDLAGIEPWPAYLAHASAKAGLHHFTRCLALALAPEVRVNAVAPGLVDPPPGWTSQRVERFRHRIPRGRLPRTEEVVEAVLLLVENEALTGQILVVDGGQSLSF